MTRFVPAAMLGMIVFGTVPASAVDPRGGTAGRVQSPPTYTSDPIDDGYVVMDGNYIAPPYQVQVQGGDVLLNGRILQKPSTQASGVRGPSGGRRYRGSGGSDRALDVQEWLADGSLLLVQKQRLAYISEPQHAHWLLRVLNCNEPVATKFNMVVEESTVPIERQVWATATEEFVPSDTLASRLEDEAAAPLLTDWQPGAGVMYLMNVAGMALVVLAFGALLSQPPPRACRCQSCDHCGDGSSPLLQHVLLVVVLSAFDLGCTLMASATGVMTELNPMAGSLIQTPWALAAFKLSATLVGATILLGLRRQRRAQVASWWLCLVCSLLTFRWVAFHSLFMT
jgi:hypothetical protein